ncbi:hypothetical protein KAW38_03350 [Candidatus Micrarchaeota archaeon]|nr:hypothetical protein [Candidatus Micrarchaeota archaeon]
MKRKAVAIALFPCVVALSNCNSRGDANFDKYKKDGEIMVVKQKLKESKKYKDGRLNVLHNFNASLKDKKSATNSIRDELREHKKKGETMKIIEKINEMKDFFNIEFFPENRNSKIDPSKARVEFLLLRPILLEHPEETFSIASSLLSDKGLKEGLGNSKFNAIDLATGTLVIIKELYVKKEEIRDIVFAWMIGNAAKGNIDDTLQMGILARSIHRAGVDMSSFKPYLKFIKPEEAHKFPMLFKIDSELSKPPKSVNAPVAK